jgi:hypothetical protein
MSRFVYIALSVILGGIALIVWWTNREANKLVDEANMAIDEANASVQQAGAKFDELFANANVNGFPENREANSAKAKEAAEAFSKAVKELKLAADEFEKAADSGVKAGVATYWRMKAQSLRKVAEANDARREMVLLFADDTISDAATFKEKMQEANQKVLALDKEVDDLAAQAKKLEEDNKSELSGS